MVLHAENQFDLVHHSSSREAAELQSLLREFSWLKGAELIQVGQSGWLIERHEAPRQKGSPLLSLDFDDLVVDSVGAKRNLAAETTTALILRSRPRPEQALVAATEATVPLRNKFDPIATELVRLSDAFARWQHPGSKETIYHCEAQTAALAFCLESIAPLLNTETDFTQALKKLEHLLQAVHAQSNPELRQLKWLLQGDKLIVSPQTLTEFAAAQKLINSTLLRPKPIIGVVAGIAQLLARHTLTPIMLSSGVPSFQLQKIGHFFEHNPIFRPVTVALARQDKGVFLHDAEPYLKNLHAESHAPLQISHLDDLPKVATSLTAAIPELSAVELAVGRCKLPTGKAAEQDWQPDHHGSCQFDFSNLDITAADFPGFFVAKLETWLRSNRQIR